MSLKKWAQQVTYDEHSSDWAIAGALIVHALTLIGKILRNYKAKAINWIHNL